MIFLSFLLNEAVDSRELKYYIIDDVRAYIRRERWLDLRKNKAKQCKWFLFPSPGFEPLPHRIYTIPLSLSSQNSMKHRPDPVQTPSRTHPIHLEYFK